MVLNTSKFDVFFFCRNSWCGLNALCILKHHDSTVWSAMVSLQVPDAAGVKLVTEITHGK